MPRVLLLSILALPLLEIAVLIAVGREIGVLWTLILVFGAGALGVALVRLQGLSLLSSIQRDLAAGRLPAEKILSGAAIALAGLLFLLPGLLSDIAGLLLLLPPVRAILAGLIARNMTIVQGRSTTTWSSSRQAGVVDLDADDYRRTDDAGSAAAGTGEQPRLPGER